MDKQRVSKELKPFIAKIKKAFNPEKIILFGSRAEGTEWKRSDYDFIIISSRFASLPWLTRISKIMRLWDIIADVDVLPYTPDEFEAKKKNSSVVRTALKHGKLLAG